MSITDTWTLLSVCGASAGSGDVMTVELVPEYVPRDDEDEWLRLHGDLDEGEDHGV